MFNPRCCLFYWIFTSALLCTADLTSAVCLIWNNWCQTKCATPPRFPFSDKWSEEETLQWMFYSSRLSVGSRTYMCSARQILELSDFIAITPSRGWRGSGLYPRKQRRLKSSFKYLPLVPRGSRETRECFSALILKEQAHEGKKSEWLWLVGFFSSGFCLETCPSSKTHDIRGENHCDLLDLR